MTLPEIAEPASVALAPADKAMRRDPLAGFTDHQWYFHQARQTVYFAASSSEAPDAERLTDLAADIADHIPELGKLYSELTGRALCRDALAGIVALEETDDLGAYPDMWDMSGKDLFARTDLPMLRVRAAVRRKAPDDAGRRAVIMVLSTHALFEGADSALLSQSQSAGHQQLAAPSVRPSALRRLGQKLTAAVLGPAQLLAALAIAPRKVDIGCRSLAFERDRIRRIAARHGLTQRSLMFALVCFALFREGSAEPRRRISTIYTSTDMRMRAGAEGAYFRHWITEAAFRVHEDFLTFARSIDTELARLEQNDARATQGLLASVFGVHRKLRRWLPFLYSDRIFRFAGFYDINLSVTPPHRLKGPLTANMMEPVFAGTFHPGLDMCIFVPGRKQITFNFALRRARLARLDAIASLLDELDA